MMKYCIPLVGTFRWSTIVKFKSAFVVLDIKFIEFMTSGKIS